MQFVKCCELFDAFFTGYDCLSVVSMELLSPHKVAVIRPAHGNERLLDLRIVVSHDI